jgi:uncharacterized membrane protein
MSPQEERHAQLLKRLELLLKRQDDFAREINSLKTEIYRLKDSDAAATPEAIKTPQAEIIPETKKQEPEVIKAPPVAPAKKPIAAPRKKTPKTKGNLEKFIGENLISKIGILITIIGVAIGVKYSIENDLISPLTRIILGYLAGIALLVFGIRLKKKYENYSAVLVSGAIAILYFITFAAYDFYSLIPQAFAFALMVVFTVFGVVAAINYNRQIIALIGLVGAYAIPFLLSEGSGQAGILFTYMAIINSGILIISFKRDWKPLYYTAFGLSWIIYASWYLSAYEKDTHFGLAFLFLTVFFIIFYATLLAYKLLKNEKLNPGDVILLLINAFIFYGIGYALLNYYNETTKELLGLFTLGNALVHFAVSLAVYRKKMADKSLFYLIVILVLTFVTIAFPVQLDGNWVTLLWTAEAALLFWLGRTKNIPVYEYLCYPLLVLASFSLLHDWIEGYDNYYDASLEGALTPLFNIYFLTSLLFVGAMAFINYLHHSKNYVSPFKAGKFFEKAAGFILASALIISVYWAFRLEIYNYFNQLYGASALELRPDGNFNSTQHNYDLRKFSTIWTLNYSMLFMGLLVLFNLIKLKNRLFGFIAVGLSVVTLFVFLTQGLYVLGELRESYLDQTLGEFYKIGVFNVGIRYISFVLAGFLLYACYRLLKTDFMNWRSAMGFDILLHITVLWIASSELISWMDIAASTQSYKLGLSILWGVYALLLIALGIWKKKKYLRIGAIILFGITLIKLFFYDISHLNTIAKTIVFVSLGVLLLIISFLYNKYKHIISDEAKE